ncbi:MAG: hypothetical protein ACR2IV_23060 [Bryobacteraceae bacterium]
MFTTEQSWLVLSLANPSRQVKLGHPEIDRTLRMHVPDRFFDHKVQVLQTYLIGGPRLFQAQILLNSSMATDLREVDQWGCTVWTP